MATLDDLCNSICAYLCQVRTDFTTTGTDFVLQAVNNSKKWAQQQRDFEAARTVADVTVSLSTGGLLSSAVLTGTATPVNVKLIETAMMKYNDGGPKPILFVDAKTKESDLRRRLQGWPYRSYLDSPPISQQNAIGTEDTPQLVQQGDKLILWPQSNSAFGSATSFVVTLDCVQWMPDYTSTSAVTIASAGTATYNGVYTSYGSINGQALYISAANSKVLFWLNGVWYLVPITALSTSVAPTLGYSLAQARPTPYDFLSPDGTYAVLSGSTAGTPTALSATTNVGSDFFLVHGFEFLLWRSMIECNHLAKEFVPRTEGNLPPPTDKLAAAWAAFLQWDGAIIGENTTSFDLD